MDANCLALAGAFWLAGAGPAIGCARLGGPKS